MVLLPKCLRKLTAALLLVSAVGCGLENKLEDIVNNDDEGNQEEVIELPEIVVTPKKVGLNLFGIRNPSFDCDNLISQVNALPKIYASLLLTSFGESNACLGRLSMRGRLESLQFHLEDETCKRGQRCNPDYVLADVSIQEYEELVFNQTGWLFDKVRERVFQIEAIINDLEINDCYISLGLESNLSKDAAGVLARFIRSVAPERCELVWNPVSNVGPIPEAKYYEHHSGSVPTSSANCIASNDGTHIERYLGINYPRRMNLEQAAEFLERSECEVTYLWSLDTSNGLTDYHSFMFPNERQFPEFRGEELIRLLLPHLS